VLSSGSNGGCNPATCCCISGTVTISIDLSNPNARTMSISGSLSGQCTVASNPSSNQCLTNSACNGNGNTQTFGGTTYCCSQPSQTVNMVIGANNQVTCSCSGGTTPSAPNTFLVWGIPFPAGEPIRNADANTYKREYMLFDFQPYTGSNKYRIEVTADNSLRIVNQDVGSCSATNAQPRLAPCTTNPSNCGTQGDLSCSPTATNNIGTCVCRNGYTGSNCQFPPDTPVGGNPGGSSSTGGNHPNAAASFISSSAFLYSFFSVVSVLVFLSF
jgi:hypothetical protein